MILINRMGGRVCFLGLLVAIIAALASWYPARAHAPGVVLSGVGTATIDGVMTPGEWDGAGTINFLANIPAKDGGGTTPVSLFVMNDATNLYLALSITRSSFGGATNPIFEFDNNHNGAREDGDDTFGMFVGLFSPPTYADGFRITCPGAPAGTVGCAAFDIASIAGFPPPGTSDGATAASNDGTFTVIELSHPLDDADDIHDFSLQPGDTVGFTQNLRLFNLVPPFDSIADTSFPTACLSCAGLFGDIVIASPAIRVTIDIKPGSFPNSINPRSMGTIPVSILSTADFDAPSQVAPSSLTFGRTGDELSLISCSPSPEDVNADGQPDLVCHFQTWTAGFQQADSEGILKGQTVGGTPLIGVDTVNIVPRE